MEENAEASYDPTNQPAPPPLKLLAADTSLAIPHTHADANPHLSSSIQQISSSQLGSFLIRLRKEKGNPKECTARCPSKNSFLLPLPPSQHTNSTAPHPIPLRTLIIALIDTVPSSPPFSNSGGGLPAGIFTSTRHGKSRLAQNAKIELGQKKRSRTATQQNQSIPHPLA